MVWYKGSLTTHLLAPVKQKPLETLQDVLDSELKVSELFYVLTCFMSGSQ